MSFNPDALLVSILLAGGLGGWLGLRSVAGNWGIPRFLSGYLMFSMAISFLFFTIFSLVCRELQLRFPERLFGIVVDCLCFIGTFMVSIGVSYGLRKKLFRK